MHLPAPSTLGLLFGVSEVALALARRAGPNTKRSDRHSLAILWSVILISVTSAVFAAFLVPKGALPHRQQLYLLGLGLFIAGLLLRWYSIIRLGRFFTVDVAIAHEHRVIDSGPYRLIRHPSYTGILLAFVGLGLCLGNWVSLLIVTLLPLGAFLWRITVEERALADGLGEEYLAYVRRTKRLVPFVY